MPRICFIFILISALNIFCQEPDIRFRHLTVKDGLSQSWILNVKEDSKGYMWFGSGGGGLNKYNGYEFTVYKHDINIDNSLSNNIVYSIYEDRKQNLWVGTQGGFNVYDRERDKFISYPVLERELIDGFYDLGNGKMLIGAGEGLFLFNSQDTSIRQNF